MTGTTHSAKLRATLWSVLLVLATLAAYWQVRHFEFTHYDDEDYVTRNPMVLQGVTWDSLRWAMVTTHFSYWHPLTWLSHILDVEMFGTNAGAHHLTNLFIHILAALALFGALNRATRALEPSAFVAALFAVHPLHVESVAWIAERKDVLSTLFWFLTMWAYAMYAQRPSSARYVAGLALFVCGLMSKPMLVTVPCVLLLMDFWPLGRLRLWPENGPWFAGAGWKGAWSALVQRSPVHPGRLLMEKVPYLALAVFSSAITFIGVYSTNRMLGTESVSIGLRLANVPISYVRYMAKMILPEDMVILYPMPDHWEVWMIVGSSILLVLISGMVLAWMRRAPWLVFGWLWFLGTLVPTIGIIPVGWQSIADRYTYVPLVGLFLMVTWTVCDLVPAGPQRKPALAAGAFLVLLGLSAGTWLQTRHWQNSETLFRHAVAVSTNNAIAQYNLGLTLHLQGNLVEAAEHYQASIRIHPGQGKAHNNLGFIFHQLGQYDQATNYLWQALRENPRNAQSYLNLGTISLERNELTNAWNFLLESLALDPKLTHARLQLGRVQLAQNAPALALEQFQQALTLDPNHAETLRQAAWLLATHPEDRIRNGPKALEYATRLLTLPYGRTAANLMTLAAAQAESEDFPTALNALEEALHAAAQSGDVTSMNQCRAMAETFKASHPYRAPTDAFKETERSSP